MIHEIVIDEVFSDYENGNKKRTQLRGIKDTNLFNSALYEPKQTFDKKELYFTILMKASCYMRSFAMNHPFFDGNKRTALLATITFLEKNGYEVIADNEKLFKLVEKVVKGKLSIISIERRLKKFVKPEQNRRRLMTLKEFIFYVHKKAKVKSSVDREKQK